MAIAKLSDITFTDVKNYYNIPSTDTSHDSQLTIIIAMAIDIVKEYCNNDFEIKARVDRPSIVPLRYSFMLNYYPVASIESLTEENITLIEDSDFYVHKEYGKVDKKTASSSILTESSGGCWSTDSNAIEVNYTAGEALTQDVVMVIYEIVGIRAGIKKRTYTDNEGVEATVVLNSIPEKLLNILNKHKKAVINHSST